VLEPLRSRRLIIRPAVHEDVDPLVARRNDAQVAALQDWPTPYSRAAAEAAVAETVAMTDGPADGGWWMTTLVEAATGQVVGDMSLHLTNRRRTAEVGYSLDRAQWGRGFAVEGLQTLLDWAFAELPLSRAFGMLHPDNRASAMLLERVGMLFEGHTRLSYWLADENSDDLIYGMTRTGWEAWRRRRRDRPQDVALVPITPGNRQAVAELRTHHSQQAFVAPVLQSFAEALLPEVVDGHPLVPWLRAITADEELVGFLMVARSSPAQPEPLLWRLLIDRMHQRRGIATLALQQLAAQVRAWGDPGLLTSWQEGRGSPRNFYLARGFVPTGRVIHGETEGRLALD
jgi:RimJ/RimL family protein N-acetyltransferase